MPHCYFLRKTGYPERLDTAMKKELLRITNLNYQDHQRNAMTGIHLCVFEGDCIGFLGLADSGKNFFLDFLCGEIEENLENYHIYLYGERVIDTKELRQAVYRMRDAKHIVESWTVAEYIGLAKSRWLLLKSEREHQEKEADLYFRKLGISIRASAKMRDLDEYEKMMVDVVKAISLGCRLIVMEGEFEDLLPEELEKFHDIVRKILAEYGMGLIFNMNSSQAMMKYMQRYVIFRDGKIIKKCRPEDIQSKSQLERYLLGSVQNKKKKRLDEMVKQTIPEWKQDQEVGYSIHNLQLGNDRISNLDFEKGRICTFLSLDDTRREQLFQILSGRKGDRSTWWLIENQAVPTDRLSELTEKGIASVRKLSSREESFSNMTVNENLLLPSLQKLGSLEYVRSESQLRKMKFEIKYFNANQTALVKNLDMNDYITLSMEKWYLFNPKLLILLDPFEQCDVYGVSIIKSYIMKMRRRGTAVIIIKAKEEYITDISDEIINLD